jgi:bifunctional non-homologous end joining protein LigD
MLATLVREPFHRADWIYEEKYDGYRIVAYKEGRHVTLLSRNAKDRTATFPAVAQAVAALPARALALDGEVVLFDRHHVSRFQLLQNLNSPPRYAVFDCLYLDGRDLRKETLADRRIELARVIGRAPAKTATIFLSTRLDTNGLKSYEIARRRGLEGVLAKDASSLYTQGRSGQWLKFKVHQEDEFVIVGYTAPAGSRQHFGALLLGAYAGAKLRYVGKVGTGFSQEVLANLFRKFKPHVRATPAIANPPREKNVTYLAPRLVAQISYGEWTNDRKLRQPVFLGLRDDKKPEDVTLPEVK